MVSKEDELSCIVWGVGHCTAQRPEGVEPHLQKGEGQHTSSQAGPVKVSGGCGLYFSVGVAVSVDG